MHTTMTRISQSNTRSSAVSHSSPCCNLSIHFCNTRGLHSNLSPVHQHLETERPLSLFLTETQISSPLDSTHLQYPNYELHDPFRFKGGTCAFFRSDLICCRMPTLEFPSFDALWLKSIVSDTQIFLCCLYRFPNDSDHVSLFSYLSDKKKSTSSTLHIQTLKLYC